MITHKTFIGAVLVLAVLAGALFAASSGVDSEMKYFSYENQILSVVTGAPQTAYYSGVNLTISNNLPVKVTNVEISYTVNGQLTTQKFASIDANSATSIVVVSNEGTEALPTDAAKKAQEGYKIKFDPVGVRLEATGEIKVGEEAVLKLTTTDGKPIAGVVIYVTSPDVKVMVDTLTTDSNGEARFKPQYASTYNYGVAAGLNLTASPETAVSEAASEISKVETPTAAAITKEEESTVNSILEKFTMVVIGLVVVAILLLGVVTFYSQRGSREDAEPPADGDYEYPAKEDSAEQDDMLAVPKLAEEKKEVVAKEIVPIPPLDVPAKPPEPESDVRIAVPEKEETIVSDAGSKFPALERLKQRVAQKESALDLFMTKPVKVKEKVSAKTWKSVAKNVKFSQKASKGKAKPAPKKAKKR
ncbi:Uncharacterised protein [Candidatus Gugararchaeum adminiculabundum]|nr:Uncharacterised protein [Candidatus Gugararchaeum adminiculabundum]